MEAKDNEIAYNKGDRTLMENNRRVSIIVQLQKFSEMEVRDQVTKHLLDNNIFHDAHNTLSCIRCLHSLVTGQ